MTDGPNEDLDRLALILNGAVGGAQKRVSIMTPYFLPSRELIGALQSAALRGVAVEVVLPVKNNLPFVDWATRNMLWELLQRGVRVFYQPPPFAHSKLFLVDDRYGLIGSPNIDPRSLRLNFELAVEVYDAHFARRAASHIRRVIERSREVTMARSGPAPAARASAGRRGMALFSLSLTVSRALSATALTRKGIDPMVEKGGQTMHPGPGRQPPAPVPGRTGYRNGGEEVS